MKLAKDKPSRESTKTFCSLGTNLKSLKMKMKTNKIQDNNKQQNPIKIKVRLKFEINRNQLKN